MTKFRGAYPAGSGSNAMVEIQEIGFWETLNELAFRKRTACELGGPESIERLHAKGKLTARERLERLLDPNSFTEIGILAQSLVSTKEKGQRIIPADGVVVGWGTIKNRKVFVSADDGTLMGGTRGYQGEQKVSRLKNFAITQGCPLISFYEASASRIQEAMSSKFAGGAGYIEHVQISGTVPLVASIMGGCFGLPSFFAMLSDFVPIVKGTGFMGMSGPPVVLGGVGEEVSEEELGGSRLSCEVTGMADYEAQNEDECIEIIKKYLSYMPQSCWELPPHLATTDPADRKVPELLTLVPIDPRRAYDMYKVIQVIVDDGDIFPLKRKYAKNIITCLARLNGQSVGIIANQPIHLAGVLDHHAARKVTRFIHICDSFNIPLIFLQDVPGFIVGSSAEKERSLAYAMRMVTALAEATVPKFTVIVRKAYGLAYHAMCGRSMKPDLIVGWPTASIAMMGPEAGVNVIYRKELKNSKNPETLRNKYLQQFLHGSSYHEAASNFAIDDVIDPQETRRILVRALNVNQMKGRLGRKHPIWP